MSQYRNTHPKQNGQEILSPSSARKIDSGPLPDNPLVSSLNTTAFSIGGVLNRARTRAELSCEALGLYKHLAITAMRQQVDVLLQGGELIASAKKRQQFEAFLAANAELVDRLWDRLEETVNAMKDGELRAVIAAEEEAQLRRAGIAKKVESQAIDAAAGERLAELIDEHRIYKAAAALDRCAEFLDELKRQMTMTIRALESDTRRFL